MKENYDEWMVASVIADAILQGIKAEIEGDVHITMDELMNVKFDTVSNIGFFKRKGQFFIMNTKEPKNYGEDARNYTWYNVEIKTREDMEKLGEYILKVFGVRIDTTNNLSISRCINALCVELSQVAKVVDWGACHVTHLPVNKEFLKVGA